LPVIGVMTSKYWPLTGAPKLAADEVVVLGLVGDLGAKTTLVVVALGDGVNFLMDGAKDPKKPQHRVRPAHL
jgi:hypothetical protein